MELTRNSEFGIRPPAPRSRGRAGSSEWTDAFIPNFWWTAGALALGLLAMPTANACPGCKEALFDPGALPQKLATARGYNWSILLLLLMPALLVGGLTGAVVWSHRRRPPAQPH